MIITMMRNLSSIKIICSFILLHKTRSSCFSFLMQPPFVLDGIPKSMNYGSRSSILSHQNEYMNVVQQDVMGSLYQVALVQPEATMIPQPPRLGEETAIPYERTIVLNVNLQGANQILCLYRFKVWWMKPMWVNHLCDIPPETLMLLWKNCDGSFHLCLAVPFPIRNDANVVKSCSTSSLRSSNYKTSSKNGDTMSVTLVSNCPSTGIYIGSSHINPYMVIQEGVTVASNLWRNSRKLKTESFMSIQLDESHSNPIENEGPGTDQERQSHSGNIIHTTLGWCTWNAFYTNVTDRGILNTLEILKFDYNIPIRWMIIDDGWQDTVPSTSKANSAAPGSNNSAFITTKQQNDSTSSFNGLEHHTYRLKSLREDRNKLNILSLQETVQLLKKDRRLVDAVLVWHTLSGYWLGLDCEITANGDNVVMNESNGGIVHENMQANGVAADVISSQLYYPKFSTGILDNDPSSSQEASVVRGIGIPNDAFQFYHQYHHTFLRNLCDIDGIKVDAQAVTGMLQDLPGNLDETHVDMSKLVQRPLSLLLHTALAKSVTNNFLYSEVAKSSGRRKRLTPVIHCMAHSPEIFYRLPSLYEDHTDVQKNAKPFFRAADDYYPDNPSSYGAQIVACAFNSLIFSHVSLPDWDMFTTTMQDERYLRMHAIARCISGGPVYLSDAPTAKSIPRHDVIDWLACTDGTTFPCKQTALPIISSLFVDPLSKNPGSPLILWNINEDETSSITSGLLGLFRLDGSGYWDTTLLDYTNGIDNDNNENVMDTTLTLGLSPSDIPVFNVEAYNSTSFVALFFFGKTAEIVRTSNSIFNVSLSRLQSESITLVPIVKVPLSFTEYAAIEIVALGLRGKINGVGAIQKRIVKSNNKGTNGPTLIYDTKGCGEFVVAFRTVHYFDGSGDGDIESRV